MNISEVIDYLLASDTSKLFGDLADSVIKNPSLIETFPHALGIIVLAVDDAKTLDSPTSQNALYLDTYHRAKTALAERSS